MMKNKKKKTNGNKIKIFLKEPPKSNTKILMLESESLKILKKVNNFLL
jgi:DNA polymerase III delta subunit